MTVTMAEQALLDECNAIWEATRAQEQHEEMLRKSMPRVRLWDGEMRLQHLVSAEYGGFAELVENDTAPIEIQHPYDHPVGQWIMEEYERLRRGEKRNITITVDHAESRISGLLEYAEVEPDDDGVQVVTARFSTDHERLKWYTAWSAPFFPAAFQAPKVFLLPGPIPWILSTTLQLQMMRENGTNWVLPHDPNDLAQQGGLNRSAWPMVVKPLSFAQSMASGALWGIVVSRWKNFHELAKSMMQDGEITCVIRTYLDGDPQPWPGANLRHGTRVVSFEDRSGTYTGTAHGGTVWDGLARTYHQFAADFIDSTEHLVTDTTIPPSYYEVGSKRTQKQLPIAVWRDGEITGLTSYRFRITPSKGVQVLTGGQSAPGVDAAISATIQMAGDLVAMMIGVPPIGGAADALLAPLYTNVVLAWMQVASHARQLNSGWQRYFELFQQGAGKAYTIASLMVLRQGFWLSRSYASHEFNARDGAPFMIGETGHVWIGDRAGYTIRNDRTGRIYMDRVTRVRLEWGRETWPEFVLNIGDDRALRDPASRIAEQVETLFEGLQQAGVW